MFQNMRSINEYVQVITRYDRSIDINDDSILIYILKNLDFELQRDIEIFFIDDNCKIDIIDFVDETLTYVFEMKDVKCNNIYLNILELKVDF